MTYRARLEGTSENSYSLVSLIEDWVGGGASLIVAGVLLSVDADCPDIIRASVDALCRDGTSEISRDPRTKRLQTRRESLAMPSKHTNNNF